MGEANTTQAGSKPVVAYRITIVVRHSVRSDFTGFASAALTISLLITVSAIITTKRIGIKNIHQVNEI